jgi:zinc transporter ZupT
MVTPLTVLFYASIAALSALPGGLVRWRSGEGQDRWIGWAHALAAGGMLGAAFVLTAVPAAAPVSAALGGVLGVAVIAATHAATGLDTLDLSRPDSADPTSVRRLMALHVLHAGTEGVAIGAAMAVDLSLGVFMALAIAVHNVPEAALLTGATLREGEGRAGAVTRVVLSNAGQPVLAVTAWLLIAAVPSTLPWALGFAVGALLNLVLTELLPASYREAGSTSIALVASVALGLVVLLGGILP